MDFGYDGEGSKSSKIIYVSDNSRFREGKWLL